MTLFCVHYAKPGEVDDAYALDVEATGEREALHLANQKIAALKGGQTLLATVEKIMEV